MISGLTWVVTGKSAFGQDGRVASAHFPGLGIWFLLLVPVVAGLAYGFLIDRFAPEARGHGVPEVMLAVAENDGRIRPRVTVVKALASTICIAGGGSVGREGPIVQIGSAFASTVGQAVHLSPSRLRMLVACGAAGGIAATFNAPVTGTLFGFELILRTFSLEAILPLIISSAVSDLIGQAFWGRGAILSSVPHDLVIVHPVDYLLIGFLGVVAAAVGVGFTGVLYKVEDVCDRLWRGRPEWARPVAGGVLLGAILLALPELYGVGYPVIDQGIGGKYVLWFLLMLLVGKIIATSVTIGIGGSGGVFAPSLFIGAFTGVIFGLLARDALGGMAGPPAVYALVAMGAVFAAASRAPLTAIASVAEMTVNFTLLLPIMLAVGIAVLVSHHLRYGTIYTTKLLRRGVDIDRLTETAKTKLVS
jgi:CIC family chloride channel protein